MGRIPKQPKSATRVETQNTAKIVPCILKNTISAASVSILKKAAIAPKIGLTTIPDNGCKKRRAIAMPIFSLAVGINFCRSIEDKRVPGEVSGARPVLLGLTSSGCPSPPSIAATTLVLEASAGVVGGKADDPLLTKARAPVRFAFSLISAKTSWACSLSPACSSFTLSKTAWAISCVSFTTTRISANSSASSA